MSLIADFQQFVKDAESGTQYEKWAHDNPGDLGRWHLFRDSIISGARPSVPTMVTPHGRELIDAGVIFLDATAPVNPPPPPPTGTYEELTAWSRPPFTGTTIRAHTPTDLVNAAASFQPGQRIVADPMSFSGELTFDKPTNPDWAEFDLSAVTFQPGAITSVYARRVSKLRLFGAKPRGCTHAGILVAQADGLELWNLDSRNNGGDGLDMFPGFGPIKGVVVRGYLENNGLDLANDPHAEKGTGIHGANLSDSSHTFGVRERVGATVPFPMVANVIALDIYDQPTGAGIEFGSPSQVCKDTVFYIRARKLGRALPGTTWGGYAKSQTAGNAIQFWGGGAIQNVRIAYLEVDSIMGRAVEAGGFYNGVTGSGITVEHARAVRSNLSRTLAGATLKTSDPYDRAHGLVLQDVA